MQPKVWCEKYRPTDFDKIVLDPLNKRVLKNIINMEYFPNLLLYGPPGTGKTTTIINLVSAYQEKTHQQNRELVIHLNASDERGIDVIRSQISLFVNSKTLFQAGMKFVILDEVDYMTKNAQQALRYLLQEFSKTVRFCLICNYISRIEEGLQHDFLRLKFNQLPKKDMVDFLKHISVQENLGLSRASLSSIQRLYKSDIRSMINFMQTNHRTMDTIQVMDNQLWEKWWHSFPDEEQVARVSERYNLNKKNVVKDFLNYLIRHQPETNIPAFFHVVENIVHFNDCPDEYYVRYVIGQLTALFRKKVKPVA